MELVDEVRPYTKSSVERIEAMISSINEIEARNIEGDIVECGVWKAGNIVLARRLAPSRVCWLYDTFEGMTLPDAVIDSHGKGKPRKPEEWVGKSAVSMPEVIAILRELGVYDEDKLRFVKGDVVETLKYKKPNSIALLRLDTDWYASTAAELFWLYPRLVPGGILIVDDYGHWLGARKAVDEYFSGALGFERIDYTAIMMRKT
jgi:hypothetical protein